MHRMEICTLKLTGVAFANPSIREQTVVDKSVAEASGGDIFTGSAMILPLIFQLVVTS